MESEYKIIEKEIEIIKNSLPQISIKELKTIVILRLIVIL